MNFTVTFGIKKIRKIECENEDDARIVVAALRGSKWLGVQLRDPSGKRVTV